ncbi:kinase-like protein [Gigaspora margarita]|uniref:Kinase-like protein n=1 Tax=Gigaspora margarita TaxID=4874 RepID=A0A8H3XFU7_GIGMA|nr:kinase-like protein [Gigaspora margarita]
MTKEIASGLSFLHNHNIIHRDLSRSNSLGNFKWKPPYQSFNSVDCIAVHVFQGKRETPIEGTPQAYVNLYTKCWDEDPHKRPDAVSVLKTLDLFLTNEMSEMS